MGEEVHEQSLSATIVATTQLLPVRPSRLVVLVVSWDEEQAGEAGACWWMSFVAGEQKQKWMDARAWY